VPSWHDAPDPDAIVLVLDPGLAFGTGSHPTTRLCLQWLEQNMCRQASRCWITAAAPASWPSPRRSWAPAGCWARDVDVQAITASGTTPRGTRSRLRSILPDALPRGTFDVLVANILTNPLKALMPLLSGRVRAGGRIALSGILAEQADEVMMLYNAAFDMRLWATDDGWVCLTGVKR
jgi:ribosomal protein L11 methyltransferase